MRYRSYNDTFVGSPCWELTSTLSVRSIVSISILIIALSVAVLIGGKLEAQDGSEVKYIPLELTQCDKEDFGLSIDLLAWWNTGGVLERDDLMPIRTEKLGWLDIYEYSIGKGPEHLTLFHGVDGPILKIAIRKGVPQDYIAPTWLHTKLGVSLGDEMNAVTELYGQPSMFIGRQKGRRTTTASYISKSEDGEVEWTLHFIATDGIVNVMMVTASSDKWAWTNADEEDSP